MSSAILRPLRGFFFFTMGLSAILLSSCRLGELTRKCCDEDECHRNAKICQHPTMHALASDLDHLEGQIDKYGSVVAMQPSVWGQARLTKYREEFEKEMFKDYTGFKDSLQGALSRSDQAYLASATAISAAISGPSAGVTPASNVLVQNTTASKDQTVVTPEKLTPKDIAANAKIFESAESVKRNDPSTRVAHDLAAKGPISIEPTILLDQKARYLQHLNQIRRNNEGDDTADSPGYSLNLVRIPVSILPGKCTMKGHGAEITMTLKPYLSNELLPTTFRELVVNDLVDLLALPAARVADLVTETLDRNALRLRSTGSRTADRMQIYDFYLDHDKKQTLMKDRAKEEGAVTHDDLFKVAMPSFVKGSSRQRVASLPVPPSQVIGVLGQESLGRICKQVDAVVSGHSDAQKQVYVLDARATLRDEVNAAYDLLSQPKNVDLWTTFCTDALVHAIRTRQKGEVDRLRGKFFDSAPLRLSGAHVTVDLAWAIIVESALLNEKLRDDIRAAAANRGCPCQNVEHQPFYLPGPMLPSGPRAAFNEYVRCRWPIHVFTIDPVSQDQNIADSYSRRQELQLALTLAFVSGQINANNMTRYARRIEKDMETIAINKTQIGFSHGEDTFGWRFYPRFQSPDIDSNFKVIFRDQLIGGPSKNEEIRQTRLEPGMRECVALVMMPAFVPYVTCETTSNWFQLTNPKHKEFKLTDSVRMGKIVKSIQTCSPNIKNADCYRDGDMHRLLTKAKQLEARLPLQSMTVQVPHENTLGGFEMFNTGVADLAPELTGWYGAPGIVRDAETQLFLVGDHFSVHHTKVTAGGQDVAFELISRQIMRVIIPEGVAVSTRNSDLAKPGDKTSGTRYVDVHVATPYGVTSHLEVPVIEPIAGPAPGKKVALSWTQESVEVDYVNTPTGIAAPATPASRPPVAIQWISRRPTPAAAQIAAYELTLTVPKSPDAARPNDRNYTVKIPFTGSFTKDQLLVPAGDLDTRIVGAFAKTFGADAAPAPLVAVKTTLFLIKTDGTTESIPLTNALRITWKETKAQGTGRPNGNAPERAAPVAVPDEPRTDRTAIATRPR